ncbi:helicase-exonuclease AddAB subunit AddA [Pueribacillus theae]|uniref:ATP-dependent helicase/nuclease subunit A n=1 Tax=Pueribacillus theae TaxID=2171751 RepID=A0A2U1K6L2_9BACI|nr:helicase-exonuclease AddAB subunit AddA [Pueribacillus theae]PWA12844.1 helicase-exonuclease AddAB subunit AddA [Pueribacillus theae]
MTSLPQKPKDAHWTDEQWAAIATRNQNTLVAAAAGSGKTAVLVERIIHQLMNVEDPIDVDRLLVVTFTNAAAAEMRQRVGEALEAALSLQPGNLHLRRQLSILNRASISTLHSFCIEVLRKYYYKLALDPEFRILDETEAAIMREEIMEELFEENYSKQDNEPFFQLVDTYSSDRSDAGLQRLVERLYDFSRSHPWPEHWLDEIVGLYEVADVETIDEIPWVNDLLGEINHQLQDAKTLLERAEQLVAVSGGPRPYGEAIQSDLAQVTNLMKAGKSWNLLYEVFQELSFPSLKRISKKDEVNEYLKEEVKSLRNTAKDIIQSVHELFFSRAPHDYLEDQTKMSPLIKTLVQLVKEFGDRFYAAKLEKGVLDFSDLEHCCLKVLLEEGSTPSNFIPSETALDYKEQFIEVLVDEYQDTNLVQETIIQLVSKDNNLFMVGDVKQSIYRFRLAEPSLFLEKYKSFSKKGNENGLRIDLSRNFRSRAEVINGTNFIFRQIMNESIGELEYGKDAELIDGLDYPETDNTEIEMLLIDRSGANAEEETIEDVEEAEREQLEASLIANKIKQLIGKDGEKQSLVYDKKLKRMRPITYRDIVILMRSTSTAAGTVMEELKRHGIPAYVEMSTGYFEATEIAVMMSLLKIIDNPDQDIPLASVLRSPIVGLTEEELANIRIADRSGSFFDAMKTLIEQNDTTELHVKLGDFYGKLVNWRTVARQGALSDVIWQIYRETHYYDFVGGLPGGMQRQANLRALYDRARQYEKTSFRGLFRFLRFIERMQDKGKDLGTARALGEQEDVVRLMTIHKSKGLEFPVVFIAGLSKQFNMQDLNAKVLLHKNYGLGTKFIDTDNRISYPTLLQLGIKEQMHKELLAEEMRVLYVAMTRAREKLFLIATVKEAEKQIQKWQQHLWNQNWLLADYERRKSKSYLDWLGPALIRHKHSEILRSYLEVTEVQGNDIYLDESKWNVSIVPAMQLITVDENEQLQDDEKIKRLRDGRPVSVENDYRNEVYGHLSWTYPNQPLTEIKSKQTVTELKRQNEWLDEQSDQVYVTSFSHPAQERPRFLQKNKLTAAERGTAMHTLMQHLPFAKTVTETVLRELLDKLVNKEILTVDQAKAIDLSLILDFAKTPLFDKLAEASKTYRETPFTYSLPAAGSNDRDERVIIQGVIDLVIEEKDGLILLDYKTDAITGRFQKGMEEAEPILKKRYEVQLSLYEKAIHEIWKKPVKEKYLYFFDGSHILQL